MFIVGRDSGSTAPEGSRGACAALIPPAFSKKGVNMDELLTLLGNYAFPIVCCAALFWKMDKDEKNQREYMEKRDELHREEISSLKQSYDNNTAVLIELKTMMKGDKNG